MIYQNFADKFKKKREREKEKKIAQRASSLPSESWTKMDEPFQPQRLEQNPFILISNQVATFCWF